MAIKTHNVLRGSYRNILEVWDRTPLQIKDEGAEWYPIAREIGHRIDERFDLVPNSGAGILAALSPSMEWGNNITEAWNLCNFGHAKRQSTANNIKALRILHGDDPMAVLGGNKVRNFYLTIIGDPNARAVVDRHAVGIYMAKPVSDKQQKGLTRKGVYDRIAGAYERAAQIIGTSTEHVQAATWTQWRIEKGLAV